MNDVEFLISTRNSFKRSILYKYSVDYFKVEVYNKIKDIFEFRGLIVREVDYSNFKESIISESLLGETLIIIDLNQLSKKDLILFSEKLVKEELKNRFLILWRIGSNTFGELELKAIEILETKCSLIDEIKFNKSSIIKIIKYLSLKLKGVFDFESLINKDIFVSSMQVYLERGDKNIFKFLVFCEEAIILCIEDSVFNLELFNLINSAKEKEDYYIVHKLLFNIMSNNSESFKDRLYKYFSFLYVNNKYSSRLLIHSITKVIRELWYINKNIGVSEEYFSSISEYRKKFLEGFNSIPIKRIIRFYILFAKYECKLNSGDFLVELYNFLIDY